nr:hypothetical protein BaRGS_022331 [Batillaria attramentaria]
MLQIGVKTLEETPEQPYVKMFVKTPRQTDMKMFVKTFLRIDMKTLLKTLTQTCVTFSKIGQNPFLSVWAVSTSFAELCL